MNRPLAVVAIALLAGPFGAASSFAQAPAPSSAPASGGAQAAGAPLARAGSLVVERAWVRATRPGQQNAGGYVEVRNIGRDDDRLVAARVDRAVAATTELHTMRMDGDVMRMRAVDAFPIPAGGRLELRPGGDHLMLLDLRKPLATGQRVAVTLRFERAGELRLDLPVEASAPGAPSGAAGMSAGDGSMPPHGHADHGHGHGGHGTHGVPAAR